MRLRRLALKIGVTVAGPAMIVAGVLMLVLPGPGLVVIGLGFGLLATEYPWARRVVVAGGHGLRRLKEVVFPRDASPSRRVTGLLATGAAIAGSTVLTGAVSAVVGSALIS